MSLYFQFKSNGVLYTLRAASTPEFPSKEIPYGDHLKEQFRDIAENHSVEALKIAERPIIQKLAEQQVHEYNEAMKKDVA